MTAASSAAPAPAHARWLRPLAIELALVLTVSAVFLYVCERRYGLATSAVGPHLAVVLTAFCSLAGARLTLAGVLPGRRAPELASAIGLSALLGIAALYYGLVLIGLHTWGRVISWELIRSYAVQAPELADALDLSLPVVLGLVAVTYAVLAAVAWRCLRGRDWPFELRRAMSRNVFVIAAAGLVAIAAIQWYGFAIDPPTQAGEPVALTFFPEQGARGIQHYEIDRMRAAALDRLEDEARAAFVPGTPARKRNVVLIVVDSLRPDHMGVYGYARATTPRLSRFAHEGGVRTVDGMRSSCANSACGILSLISSKYVHEYSLRPFTLYEALRKHGYRVHLVLGGDHARYYSLKELYGTVDSYMDGSTVTNRYVNDDELVLEHTRSLPPWDGSPVMMHFHLMSAHAIGKREARFEQFRPAANYVRVTHRDRTEAVNFYDNGVLQADAAIGEILDLLRSKGYLSEALIVVTSDHGEALGDHGRYFHANGVDEEVLRIPLLLMAQGYRPPPLASHGPTSIVDVAPTILYELGLPRPATWSGVPLQQPSDRRYVYFQERFVVGFMDAAEGWKYWIDTRSGSDFAAHPTAAHAPPALTHEWRLQLVRLVPGSVGPDATGGSP